jgi:hypothetical protein
MQIEEMIDMGLFGILHSNFKTIMHKHFCMLGRKKKILVKALTGLVLPPRY